MCACGIVVISSRPHNVQNKHGPRKDNGGGGGL